MTELSLKKFEEMNLYSNSTLQKVLTSMVNESSNATLVNMFEDCVLLLDHKEGQFYLADYTFNHDTAQFTLENFDAINLVKNNVDFKATARKFFENDEMGTMELAESYQENVSSQDAFISDLITESMVGKDFSETLDYSEVAEMNENVSISGEKFFNTYKERLASHPVSSIKYFNWKDPVHVSLLDTEKTKVVSKNVMEKANELWKKSEFKEAFEVAGLKLVESVEDGTEEFKKLFETYPQVLRMSAADRTTLFGKTAISTAALREHRSDLVKGLSVLFEQFDLKEMLVESEDDQDGLTAEDAAALELSIEQRKKIVDELLSFSKKVTNESVRDKLESVAEALSGEETNVEAVKEAVELLTI